MTVASLATLLGAREEELSAIYENVPGILFYIAVERNGEFRFLSVSRDFLTATGLRREQVLGSLVRDIIPPPSRDMVLNHYREAIRSGQPVRWEEKSAYPAGQKYGEVAVTALYDASGLATHLIGIVHDITERKRNETAERMETIGTRAAGLTREFNNVLDTITMNVALVKNHAGYLPDVGLRLDQISDAADKAAGLLRRLTRSRRQDLRLRSLDINDVSKARFLQNLAETNALCNGLISVRKDLHALINQVTGRVGKKQRGKKAS